MKKFNASIENLFSAEAEALNSNSADSLIQKFQTNGQKETQHPTTNIGRNQESRTGNATAFDSTIPSVPEGYSEGITISAGSDPDSAN